jgi:hypothetical protein
MAAKRAEPAETDALPGAPPFMDTDLDAVGVKMPPVAVWQAAVRAAARSDHKDSA